jgi:hypothetical protein
VKPLLRRAADWVDLQWSALERSLRAVAPCATAACWTSAAATSRTRRGFARSSARTSASNLWTVIGHKLNTYLALRVARAGQLAQNMGKLGHEAPQGQGVRWWTLPLIGPSVVSIAAGARLLDRWLVDPDESLGYLVLARHADPSP